MPLGWSDTDATAYLNWLGRNTAIDGSRPAQLFGKMHLGDPGPTGVLNPAANTTRYAITFAAPITVGAQKQMRNSVIVTLSSVPATETYTHISFWTSATTGRFVRSGTVSGGSVVLGQSPTFPVGSIILALPLATAP